MTIRNVKGRIKDHCRGKSRSAIGDAIGKYGMDSFSVLILHTSNDIDVLEALEKDEIDKRNTIVPNGYNLVSGGLSGRRPCSKTKERWYQSRWTAENRAKNAKQTADRWSNQDYKKKISESISRAHKGVSRVVSQKTRKGWSDWINSDRAMAWRDKARIKENVDARSSGFKVWWDSLTQEQRDAHVQRARAGRKKVSQ